MKRNISIFVLMSCLFIGSTILMSQTKKPAPAQNKNELQASMERGKLVYAQQCLACHQADGGGVQNMNPTLIKTKWVLGDKSKLILIVLNGLKGGEIEIDGDKFHNVMAPHKDLSDQQIADVLTYVRNSFGNKVSVVTVAQVKSVRVSAK